MSVRGACRIACLAIMAAVTGALPGARAEDVQIGDPAAKVQEILGEPRGTIRSLDKELLLYDRGRVELKAGIVTAVTLVSAEEAARQQEVRARETAARKAREAAAREARIAAGTEERDRTLANVDFLAASGARQLEYWNTFRRRYPEVRIDAEYAAALAKRDAEVAKDETERRLAEMERRVAEAENRAREAEDAAEDARQDRRRRTVYYWPPYTSYPYVNYPCEPIKPPHPPTNPPPRFGHRKLLGIAPADATGSSTTSQPAFPPHTTPGINVHVEF